MKKRTWIKWLVFLLLLGALATIISVFVSQGDGETRFRTTQVERGNITEIITASGTLNPVEIVTVGTQVSGKINAIHVEVNDEVKVGQLLAEIDPSIPEATLKQSKASMETSRVAFEQAGRDLERTRALVAKEYLPKVDLERAQLSYLSARNSYESAKTQVERDEVNLSYTKVTSPINGTVISQEVSAGQTVASNFQTPNLFKIAGDLTKMRITVTLPESDISKVKIDMPVTFTVDAFSDKTFNGRISTINLNPTNQQGVVTYPIVVEVENPDKLLYPGMTANVSIVVSEIKDVLKIPVSALRFVPSVEQTGGLQRLFQFGMRQRQPDRKIATSSNNQQAIYLLKNGEPVQTLVTTGASDDSSIEVSGGGIAEGDTVITGTIPKRID